ncbi:MAG TPA: hypothetical protein VMH83_09725 [Candidatus Acidoferrum sp.]|nr:hypothetical protein [Candidatus Acidoferrum sp.]
MLKHFTKYCKRPWLIALFAFTLAGVQLVQNSPWHDHAREVVDCALCHLQPLGDDTEIDHSLPLPVAGAQPVLVLQSVAAPVPHFPSPYQGRAPPLLLS